MATRGKRKPAHARAKLEQAAAIEAQADRIDGLATNLGEALTRLDAIDGAGKRLHALESHASEQARLISESNFALSGRIDAAVSAMFARLAALESWRAQIPERIAAQMKQFASDSPFDAVPTAIAGATATEPTR